MPINPNIPLGAVSQQPAFDPMRTMQQMYELQNMRQQQAYQQERLELQRQQEARLVATAEQKARDEAITRRVEERLAPHLTVGQQTSVRDFDIDAFINNLAPEEQGPARAMAQSWFDKQSEIASRRATATKTLQEVQKSQLEMAGQYARMIRSAKYDPQFSQGVLANWAKADPDFDPDAIWQAHGQDPANWQRFVDSVIDATGEDVTLSGGGQDIRVSPTGVERARGLPPVPPRPVQVETVRGGVPGTEFVSPQVGDFFPKPPPAAQGGEAVNRQLQKVVLPNGQIGYAGYNPRTNRFEAIETPYQPEQNLAEEIPPLWKSTFDMAAGGLTRDKRENYERQFNQALMNGRPQDFPQLVRRAAIDTENVATRNDIQSRAQTVAALSDVEKGLQELKAAGVPTDWFNGTVYDLQRRLGSGNPAQVRLGVRLNTMLSNYTKAMSGVQFSEEEAKRYKQLFPNYKNSFVVNIATIQGLRDDMAANDRTYWEGKLGKDGARLIGVPEGSFTLQGTGQPSGAGNQPTEGQRSKSKSGRAMIYRNGQWVYE